MNNKLIKKENITIFDKIKAFFKKFFRKKEKIENKIIEQENDVKNNSFKDNLKINISEINEKENKFKSFISEIENNPDLVEKLSEDRLDRLIDYYEKITKEKAQKIKRLNKLLN